MKYEIVNPSDECYLEHDDPKVAIAACLVLGEGRYGLKDPKGELTCPILLFGGEKFLKEAFGGVDEYSHFVATHYGPIADCLETVTLPRERTSMNDIKKWATTLAGKLRSRI